MCDTVDISYSVPGAIFIGSLIALGVVAGILLVWQLIRLLSKREFVLQVKSKGDIDANKDAELSSEGANFEATGAASLDGTQHAQPGELLVARESGFKIESVYPYVIGGAIGTVALIIWQTMA